MLKIPSEYNISCPYRHPDISYISAAEVIASWPEWYLRAIVGDIGSEATIPWISRWKVAYRNK
jgi:hypothetical protein